MRNLVLGFVALVLVAAIFVNRQIQSEEGVEPVLVARQLIPPGTSGNLVQSQKMVALTTLPRREVEDGAISDPLDLRSRVAAMHIFPDHQLTVGNFIEPRPGEPSQLP